MGYNSPEGHQIGGSGPPPRPSEPPFLVVGRVLRPHGVRGVLRVTLLTDFPDRLALHQVLYVGSPARPYRVEWVRLLQGGALVKLAGCDDRDAAAALRGALLQIPVAAAVPLEEGEYYHFQVLGIEVFTEQGEPLGRVVEVLETAANDVFVLRGPRGELLIPAVTDVVRELDLTARRMVVHLLPGLLGEE